MDVDVDFSAPDGFNYDGFDLAVRMLGIIVIIILDLHRFFFIQSYIGRYSGHAKLIRLQFIASKFPSLRDEAFSMLTQVFLNHTCMHLSFLWWHFPSLTSSNSRN